MKKRLNQILIFTAGLFLAVFLYKRFVKTPELPLNEAVLKNESGEIWEIASCQQDFILISYFQSWCGDCVRELPTLLALQDSVGEERLEVVLISDEPWDKIHAFKRFVPGSLPLLQSDLGLKTLGIYSYPTTYLLGPDRKVLLVKQEGFDWNKEEVHKIILTAGKR